MEIKKKIAIAKRVGEKTMELGNVRVWKGKASTLYLRIDDKPITVSKNKHPELHKELQNLFDEMEQPVKGDLITLGELADWMEQDGSRRIHVDMKWGFDETVHTLKRFSDGEKIHYVYGDNQQFTYRAGDEFEFIEIKGDYMSVKKINY